MQKYFQIPVAFLVLLVPSAIFAASGDAGAVLPTPFSVYGDDSMGSIGDILVHRLNFDIFNLFTAGVFLCAVLHAFSASFFNRYAHHLEEEHRKHELRRAKTLGTSYTETVSFRAVLFHFLGEVEAIFGIWVVVLAAVITYFKGWDSFVTYIQQVNFTEPTFVVVIMALAATRPIMYLARVVLGSVAKAFGGSTAAYWLSILTIAPILGSLITEPAAMTIGALLLSGQFYDKKPSLKFAYATIGLLFVNISIGGTFTHFAAPPVLIVADAWGWTSAFMLLNFGWKAAISICVSNAIYYFIFRKELKAMSSAKTSKKDADTEERIPFVIIAVHILFMLWTVYNAHYIPLVIGGFLFFLAFSVATSHYQDDLKLKSPLLVGFFLAGLVIHGGLQGWWIAPVLGGLERLPLFLGATALTAVNDNAAITYLSTLVPNFGEELKYAVVSGALVGGGLTVIANAPNPAGQSILNRHFSGGINPLFLFLGALIPTIVSGLFFMLL